MPSPMDESIHPSPVDLFWGGSPGDPPTSCPVHCSLFFSFVRGPDGFFPGRLLYIFPSGRIFLFIFQPPVSE